MICKMEHHGAHKNKRVNEFLRAHSRTQNILRSKTPRNNLHDFAFLWLLPSGWLNACFETSPIRDNHSTVDWVIPASFRSHTTYGTTIQSIQLKKTLKCQSIRESNFSWDCDGLWFMSPIPSWKDSSVESTAKLGSWILVAMPKALLLKDTWPTGAAFWWLRW